jgi:hypothetical protein
MALEGNLKDISLPNIMQIICLEQRRVGLFIKRLNERGFILFEKGEVVHAAAGSLEGEEAVFYMLSWGDGNFRTNNEALITNRTVNMRWDQLLLEGMRRFDELERNRATAIAASSARSISQAEIERDSKLENEALLLLSRLDQLQARLLEKNALKKPTSALETLAMMANQVVEVFEKALDQGASADSLKNVLAKVAARHPSAEMMQLQQNRLSSRSVVEIYNHAGAWKRNQVFNELSRSIIDVIDSYFLLLMSCFCTASVSDEIKEAYNLFLTDLTQAVGKINN